MGLRILPLNSAARILVIFEIWLFLGLFQIFSEKLIEKVFWNLKYHLGSEALSRFSQELQILPPSMIAQILVIFEIWRFLEFLNFSENLCKKNFA